MKAFGEPDENVGRFYIRLLVAIVFVLIGCILLAARLYTLQIKNYSHYQTLAEGNRISVLPIVPQRGEILDRNGVVLARNFVAYNLEITPSLIVNLKKTIDELSLVIAIEEKDRVRFRKFFENDRRLESAPIRTRLSDEEVARFMGQRYRFPGVDVQPRKCCGGFVTGAQSGLFGGLGEFDDAHSWGEARSDGGGVIGAAIAHDDDLHVATGCCGCSG
jgi:penicillin-binding protein 2